uniref:MD-2-related lipid-recognition domain-containing protein n=1 Tax=Glossina pallidipes TaxID=7398 RepID=A0A1A9ZHC2_GLOPL
MFKYLVAFLAALSSCVTATNVKQCQSGGPLPINVSIEGCSEPPCDVIKNETAIMRIHFVGTTNNMRSIAAQVKAKVIGLIVPYPLPQHVADVCSNLMYEAMCPIYKTEDVIYQFNFFVETIFPEIPVTIEISLTDDSRELIACFSCDIKVKSKRTRMVENQLKPSALLID